MWLPSKAMPKGSLKPYLASESFCTKEPSLALSSVTELPPLPLLATQMWLPSKATP